MSLRIIRQTHAFTLIEISIVLVILGLLLGATLSGRALVRSANLRAATTQYEKIVAATRNFHDQYNAFPGDMTNATRYWGAAHATPATCITTNSTGSQATCNGDGNNRINNATTGSNEAFRFWQHLTNAGLLDGAYSGVSGSGNTFTAVLANSPAGKLKTGGPSLWYTSYWGTVSGSTTLFDGDYGNVFEFGGMTANADPVTGIMTAKELRNIDEKVDDAKPGQGKIVLRGTLATCTNTSSSSSTNADYIATVSGSSPVCALVVRNAF